MSVSWNANPSLAAIAAIILEETVEAIMMASAGLPPPALYLTHDQWASIAPISLPAAVQSTQQKVDMQTHIAGNELQPRQRATRQ